MPECIESLDLLRTHVYGRLPVPRVATRPDRVIPMSLSVLLLADHLHGSINVQGPGGMVVTLVVLALLYRAGSRPEALRRTRRLARRRSRRRRPGSSTRGDDDQTWPRHHDDFDRPARYQQ